MKRFRIITAICLTAISILVAGNVWYLYGLYSSIREQTVMTVADCVRRADILEIIERLDGASQGDDASYIRMSLIVNGKRSDKGRYEYSGFLDNINQTMSGYFHLVEQSDSIIPPRNYSVLDSIFLRELNAAGLYPACAIIRDIDDETVDYDGLWAFDFSISDGQLPIYRVILSPLNGHILGRMSGIIVTSALILFIVGFLIFYLLGWVARLRTIEQMKDDFTHNMTHELKTPVAVAYSAADSMLRYYDQSDEARNRRFLSIILQRLSHLSGMIENILSMSMERFRTMRLNIEPVALRPLVMDVSGMIELKDAKPVAIHVGIPEGLTVQADPLHLGNVLTNLLDNAVKYSGERVDIIVNADAVSLSVEDNGIGIAKNALPYIFDKFYRVPSGDRYEVGGYGLGLYYVRQIVGLHGWTIDVDSKPGRGTKFTIRFNNNA